jgi:hypothetical protein
MSTRISLTRLLGFKEFFPNCNNTSKDYYAQIVGRELIESLVCTLLSYSRCGLDPNAQESILVWFSFEGISYEEVLEYKLVSNIYSKIAEANPHQNLSIISEESLLNLFLWASNNSMIPDKVPGFDGPILLSLLQLLLLFNEEVLENYEKAQNSIKKYGNDRKLQRLALAQSFPQNDLINVDYALLSYTQLYKLMRLLEFLESESKYTPLLNNLLQEFGSKSKVDYFKALTSAAFISMNNREPTATRFTTENNPEKEKDAEILEKLSVADRVELEQDDYLPLRDRPLQRLDKYNYRVIYDLFLLKKLYNGTIFKLSSFDEDFMGNIRSDFSEEVLLYESLNAFPKPIWCVSIPGIEFKRVKLPREPDYYLRYNDDIMLFESKDFFIKGKIKLSYDFDKIEGELKKEGRLMKAVKQLATNALRCLKQEMPLDKTYDLKRLRVFPIIIVHDSLYSASGLNYWVYYWFMDELRLLQNDPANSMLNFSKIMPITIIEIDTIILFQAHFANGSLDLVSMLLRFHEHVLYDPLGRVNSSNVEEQIMKSLLPFSEFAREYGYSKGIKLSLDPLTGVLSRYELDGLLP